MSEYVGMATMFFAGLILLIPHRIGMSRVNYVIKRYNLPISRAGLLLYKYHNNIELSLLLGTLPGNIIVWYGGNLFRNLGDNQKWPLSTISICMITFLILMLLSSIIMFIIYISGGDFGHLNAFYFSLIFLTLFDGFANAFAFGLNAQYSSLLSAGIPLSGLLVTLLHYIYKFFYDSFLWDDFDYYVLRLQLLCNIIIILIALGLWSWDYTFKKSKGTVTVGDPKELLSAHVYDFFPILMLAISLGTVYAFYPSIAPYSIIDFQYASIIELWILIISALLPIVIALLDTNYNPGSSPIKGQYGPSGKTDKGTINVSQTGTIAISGGGSNIKFTGQQITLTDIQVKCPPSTQTFKHPKLSSADTAQQYEHTESNPNTNWHPWNKDPNKNIVKYTLTGSDQYWNPNPSGGGQPVNLQEISASNIDNNKPTSITYKYYYNWFSSLHPRYDISATTTLITLTDGRSTSAATAIPCDQVNYTLKPKGTANVTWDEKPGHYWLFNLVWISAIFYILCIQIFMTLLHYPHSFLSCFCDNNPYVIVFISIFFNTLRELMQATAFSGAGKQCKNLDPNDHKTGTFNFGDYKLTSSSSAANGNIFDSNGTLSAEGQLKSTNLIDSSNITLDSNGYYNKITYEAAVTGGFTAIQATTSFKVPTLPVILADPPFDGIGINGTIAATNKLITLFVMMFCVFTGDGYLQHYRRCCRDYLPTTGYTKYQSFFYWLHFGFKGGIKSITSSFTDLYYHNLRPQFISYA